MKWFETAAAQGFPPAMCYAAAMHEFGRGTASGLPDEAKAAKLYARAHAKKLRLALNLDPEDGKKILWSKT